jgi:hypothetical protein
LAWTGTDQAHHLNVAYWKEGGQPFSEKVTLNETSIDGPGLAFGNGSGFIAWTGTDQAHTLNVGRSYAFGGWDTFPLKASSPYGPALAFGNDTLFVAWTDANHALNVISLREDGYPLSDVVTLTERSGSAPSLSFLNGVLYLLWSDDANQSLNIMQSTDGITFTNKITLHESSDFHPGLTLSVSSQYFLGWTGRDAAHSLNLLNTAEGSPLTNLQVKQTFSESSRAGVTLAAIEGGHELFMAWTGADSQLNFAEIAGYI